MTTVVVSIGRNNGTVNPLPGGAGELSDEAWIAFRGEVSRAVVDAGVEVAFDGVGTGRYEGETEQAYTLIGTIEGPPVPWAEWLDDLERTLGLLAYRYGQDSIALTTGPTRFAGAQ